MTCGLSRRSRSQNHQRLRLARCPGLARQCSMTATATRSEAPEVMAEAAFALCTGDPARVTGKVTYAKPILEELGVPVPVATR